MNQVITQEILARILTDRIFRKELLTAVPDMPLDMVALLDMAERTDQKRLVHLSRLMPYTTMILKILGGLDSLSSDFLDHGPATPDASNFYRAASDALRFSEFTLGNKKRLAFNCSYLDDVIRFDRNRVSLFLELGDRKTPDARNYIPEFPLLTPLCRIDRFQYRVASIIQDLKVLQELLPYDKSEQFILFVRNPKQPDVQFYDISSVIYETLSKCDGRTHRKDILHTSGAGDVLSHFVASGLIDDSRKGAY